MNPDVVDSSHEQQRRAQRFVDMQRIANMASES